MFPVLRRGAPIVLVASLVGAMAASPGRADPDRDAFDGLPVSSLDVVWADGDPGGLEGTLRDGLALGGERRWFGGERPLFFVATLERDVARARLLLARHGYPSAAVEPDIIPGDDGKSVRVVLRVRRGDAVRIRAARAEGLPGDFEPPPPRLAAGDVVRDDAVEGAAAALRTALRERGHAFAEVKAELTPVDSTHVDVTLVADAGERYRVAEVRVSGAAPDLAELARATTGIRPGDPFSPEKLRRAETGLRELDLFRTVRIGVEPAGSDRLVVQCELSERLPRSFTAGVGYFSDDQARVDAAWSHRNLLGGGRGVRVAGRASRFLQTVRGDLVWPRVAGRGVRGALGAAFRREDEDAYGLIDARFDFTAGWRTGSHARASAGVAVAWVEVDVRTEDPALDDPVGIVTTLPVSWIRDTSDHPLYPTRGTVTRVDAEGTPPGLGSVTRYVRGEARVSAYRAIGPTVLAARVGGGAARPLAGTRSVLASRRLFAGGSRSMRGYGRRRLGPRDEDGEPLGGEAKVEASLEWRVPLVGRVHAAAFVDAGQVWSERAAVRLRDLAWAAGPALMVRSPVGPLRIDWGILLGPTGGEPRSVVHFSVGHPY